MWVLLHKTLIFKIVVFKYHQIFIWFGDEETKFAIGKYPENLSTDILH